jgi:hypothetical protein
MAGGDGWDGKYSFRFSHTSAAAPLVAGIVGLMLDANPQLSASDVQTILQETADPVRPNDAFYDGKGFSQTYGYGRINALRAVARAYEFQGLSLPTALADAVEQASPCLRASCANPRAFGASSPSGTSPGQNGASLPPTPTSPSAGEATANAPAKSSEAAPSSANANSDANSEANSRRNESLSDDGQTSSVGAVACSTGGRPAPQSLRGFQPYFFLALAWATFRWRRKDRPTNTHMQPTPRANYKLQ